MKNSSILRPCSVNSFISSVKDLFRRFSIFDNKTVNEICEIMKCGKSKVYRIKEKKTWLDIVTEYNF